MPSFKKSLIVEQFQGNYLNGSIWSKGDKVLFFVYFRPFFVHLDKISFSQKMIKK